MADETRQPTQTVEDAAVEQTAETNRLLIQEMIEEHDLAHRQDILLDNEAAAALAEGRVTAIGTLRIAAIKATEPHQWVLFRDKQGLISARFKHAAAMTIGSFFGITVAPLTDVAIITPSDGRRRFAEIFGRAVSSVTGACYTRFRAYRIEGEDFAGRPAKDVTYRSGSKAVGVGEEDWKQSTETALQSKGVRLCSGIINCSVRELSKAWDMEEDEVIAACAKGPGFGKGGSAERSSSNTRPISPDQKRLLLGKASGRLKELKELNPDMPKVEPKDVVIECVVAACPAANGVVGNMPMAAVDTVIAAIAKWGPTPATDNAQLKGNGGEELDLT